MKLLHFRYLAGGLLLPVLAAQAFGVSCKTQAAIPDSQRAAIVNAARQIAIDVQSGHVAELKAATVPQVAANFSSIAQSAASLQPLIAGAAITVHAVYRLDAADAKPGEPQQQFFCDTADNSTQTTFTIDHLPPGQFSFALVHATGVAKPQQIALLLQELQPDSPWQLAGFFPKPLTMAGHDGLWYWKQARTYAAKKQNWNAWFYYTTAAYLLQPAGYMTTTNLDKLFEEEQSIRPAELPTAQTPLVIHSGAAGYTVTSLRTDDALGGLDLIVHYNSTSNDPVTSREHAIAVMRGLLALHPELRDAFHGLWVFADAGADGQPFSLEQTMETIPQN